MVFRVYLNCKGKAESFDTNNLVDRKNQCQKWIKEFILTSTECTVVAKKECLQVSDNCFRSKNF